MRAHAAAHFELRYRCLRDKASREIIKHSRAMENTSNRSEHGYLGLNDGTTAAADALTRIVAAALGRDTWSTEARRCSPWGLPPGRPS